MTTLAAAPPRMNLRGELRLALLAAAEACWLFAIALTLSRIAEFSRVISPFGIFIVYFAALLVGRGLPRSQCAWRLLQGATVALAVVSILVAMRIGLYTDVPIYDFSWLPTYVGRLVRMFESVTPEVISTLILVVTFVRALNLAQRPLTLWVVGFQFRLGIVVFFVVALISALSVRVDFMLWIFVYFAVSLISISLARIEEAGQERPLGAKWVGVMLSVSGATLLLGFAATRLLTLETVNAFFALLSPLAFVFQIIVTLLAIPLLFLIELLVTLLAPIILLFQGVLAEFFRFFRLDQQQPNEVLSEVTRQLVDLMPYLRLLAVIGVAMLLAWYIARALNRRMKWREEELFVTEPLREGEEPAVDKRPRAKSARGRRQEIRAESIRRIYAALLVQADAVGVTRRDAETPLEFLPRLTERFPESNVELKSITDAYIAVHYAQQNATDGQVREVRELWQRTKEKMKENQRKRGKAVVGSQ